ncbi:TolB family protein [Methylotuvimicrobium buryatense]|nr:PD40 domain-containing protein [Methylotuvimicrobium buryatense]
MPDNLDTNPNNFMHIMKTKSFIPKSCLAALTLLLTQNVSHAMPGMDMPAGENAKPHPLAKSIGVPINSSASEFELTYSADGKTVVFVSTRPGAIESKGNPYNFDIWMSHNVNGVWQTPIHLGPDIDPNVGPNINTSAWELEPSLSDDGNALYFTRYEPGNLSTGDLYVAQKVDGVWQPARNWNDVPELPNLNTPTGEEHCPIIVSDSLIYFSYQQPGVTQDSDIWKVEKKNGVWQKPQSLGPRINSPYRDHLHWTGLSKDGKSLIITSTRPDFGSRGGHDEWISYQNPQGEWQEPLNLGDTINTAGEDMCWAFTPDGKQFFGGWGPQGSYDMNVMWMNKDDVPLLKNFDPIGPPPNLLAKSKAKAGKAK